MPTWNFPQHKMSFFLFRKGVVEILSTPKNYFSRGPFSRGRPDIQETVMGLDHPMAVSQTHSPIILRRFGREEGAKKFFQILSRDPGAVISNPNIGPLKLPPDLHLNPRPESGSGLLTQGFRGVLQ